MLIPVSYLMQEFFVKSADRVELMAMLGLFGAIVSACQMYPCSVMGFSDIFIMYWSKMFRLPCLRGWWCDFFFFFHSLQPNLGVRFPFWDVPNLLNLKDLDHWVSLNYSFRKICESQMLNLNLGRMQYASAIYVATWYCKIGSFLCNT